MKTITDEKTVNIHIGKQYEKIRVKDRDRNGYLNHPTYEKEFKNTSIPCQNCGKITVLNTAQIQERNNRYARGYGYGTIKNIQTYTINNQHLIITENPELPIYCSKNCRTAHQL